MSLQKKFIFVLLIVFVLFFSVSRCFADVCINYNDTEYILPDFPEHAQNATHYLVVVNTQNYYLLFYTLDEDFDHFIASETNNGLHMVNTSGGYCTVYIAQCNLYDDEGWYKNQEWGWCQPLGYNSNIIYSTNDVYDDNGEVFFRRTPLGVVGQALEGVVMTEVMKEILGFLPLAIGLLVSVIALVNGLKILFRILKNS